MRKSILFLFFFTITMVTAGQSFQVENLKKELDTHKRQDTVRVNILLSLAAEFGLKPDDRKAYNNEALHISKKIKYTKGQGFAYAYSGSLAYIEGDIPKSEAFFHLADSIADLTQNLELKSNVLWRSSLIETDSTKKSEQLQEAYVLSKKVNNTELESKILLNIANDTDDVSKKKGLLFHLDSLSQITQNLSIQRSVNMQLASIADDLKEAKKYYDRSISISEKNGDTQLLITTLKSTGYNLMNYGDKDVINYYLKAEIIAQKAVDYISLASVQSYIGLYYLQILSDYPKAMEYYLKELKSAETANDTYSIITSWIDLGSMYTYLGDREIAVNYFLKAEEANKILGDKRIESNLQSSLGENYRLSNQYPKAIIAYHKATKLDTYRSDGRYNYVNEGNIADVYTRLGIIDSAFYYGFKSIKIAQKKNDIVVGGFVNDILSRAYLKKNMADSAIYYGHQGLLAAKESGTIEFMRDNAHSLANAYAAKKDFANAYSNHLLFITYRDSMMNDEVRNKTAVQQYTFNLDKKEAQIRILNEQKKGQRTLLIGAIALLVLILVVAGLLLRNNRQKQKANALLKTQKQEIDEKANNVELLNEIGRKITASLSIEKIIGTVYKNVNKLMDASVFGIGIYNEALKKIEFPATYENGEQLPLYANDIDDQNRFGSVCLRENKEIIINNLTDDYKDHVQAVETPHEGAQPVSIIFLPLISKIGKLGVLTVQSFQKNAYSEYQLFMLRNIATYTTVAIENAESYDELNNTLSTLKSTQTQLIQSEKMASLGQLTAGIAHEIQNPLNFVNNFSEVSNELIDEMKLELSKGNYEEAQEIAEDVKQNLEKINHHGKRADAIVKGMLQHSRRSTSEKEPTDINKLTDEYLRLAYHGLRAKDKSFNATLETDYDESIGKIAVIPQDIGRVILNLITNAFYAVDEKKKSGIENYEPIVSISTKKIKDGITISVKDNGNGIPKHVLDKIFQPFFTTKPTGQGTGLGLSLSYDIIKTHGGDITVVTDELKGTTFTIHLHS